MSLSWQTWALRITSQTWNTRPEKQRNIIGESWNNEQEHLVTIELIKLLKYEVLINELKCIYAGTKSENYSGFDAFDAFQTIYATAISKRSIARGHLLRGIEDYLCMHSWGLSKWTLWGLTGSCSIAVEQKNEI